MVERIQVLREEHPRWGREKLRVLLAREGHQVSAKTIDRVLARLRARGVLLESRGRRRGLRAAAGQRPRRPRDLVVNRPGALVQVDSKHVAIAPGTVLFQFGAIDCFSRQRVVGLFRRQSSRAGARFLEQVLRELPFPIQAIQTDGGSEFLGAFEAAVQQLGLVRYWNRPNYPQGNGLIERSFGTDEREFWQVQELPSELAGLQAALRAWNGTYHAQRPHQALGYLTPDQFYQAWLASQAGPGQENGLPAHTSSPSPLPTEHSIPGERRLVSEMS